MKKIQKIIVMIMMFMIFCSEVVFAAQKNEIAENGAKWILEGLFWAAIASGAGFAFYAFVRKNFVGGASIIFVTAIVCAICVEPEIIIRLGQTMKSVLGL